MLILAALLEFISSDAVIIMRFNDVLLSIAKASWISHAAILFVCRHWLLSLANELLTAAIGLGLLALVRRLCPPILSPRALSF